MGDTLQAAMRNRPSPAPFLFLSIRAQEAAADDEYSAIMRFGGLDEREVHRIRLDREPLGDVDLGFKWLQKACADRSFDLISLKVDPRFDPLRDDRRFKPLLKKLGFVG